jgi:hypothetical protein
MSLMLVAFGELGAAIAMARLDPDAMVRASAWRCLTRVAKPEDASLQELIATAMRSDPAPEVHAAIADAVRVDASEAVWAMCTRRLRDADDEVRTNVANALLRRHAAGSPFPAELVAAATAEARRELRHSMLRAWVGAAGSQAVVRAISDRPAPEILNALQFLRDEATQLAADDLEPLLRANEPAVDACVASMHRGGQVRLTVPSLLVLTLRALQQTAGATRAECSSRWEAARVSIDALRSVLPELAHEALSSDERRLVNLLCIGIEESLRATAAETGTQVDALVRFAISGEDVEQDSGWEVYVPGAELLVDLRRLAR